ncbi:MAG: DUF6763 family protein [Pseudomonadota bacterium]
MIHKPLPVVGEWYRHDTSIIFEVVALDGDDGTIEVQYFDGTVEEFDDECWELMYVEEIEAPEDWSGSMDIEQVDYRIDIEEIPTQQWNDPLDFFDGTNS